MTQQQLSQELKSSRYYAAGGHFRFVSGNHSDAYIQARLCLMNAEMKKQFVASAIHALNGFRPSALAGFTVGGLLLAEALSRALDVPLLVGWKEGSQVEWIPDVPDNALGQVVLVDDTLTTPSQINPALDSLSRDQRRISVGCVLVAVYTGLLQPPTLFYNGRAVPLTSCAVINMNLYSPSECPLCAMGLPSKDLTNPDTNFASVLLSQPETDSAAILAGYEHVYELQRNETQLVALKAWRQWLPVLRAGLPLPMMEQDSSLITCVRHITSAAGRLKISDRVLSEIVGQLVSLASIRIENRSIGCGLIVGDLREVKNAVPAPVRVRLPEAASSERLTVLVPYFDAYPETRNVLLLSQAGDVVAFRRLETHLPGAPKEGIDLLRYLTTKTDTMAFVLRRGRSSVGVYWGGRLEAVVELSQRTGLWEFHRPMQAVDEVNRLLKGMGDLLVPLVEVGRELVARGHGGLFIIGDSGDLAHREPHLSLESQALDSLSVDDVVEIAKLDGAVFVSSGGEITRAATIIQNRTVVDPRAGTSSAHGGSRRETARRTSEECLNTAAMYVSQNGAIEVYVAGTAISISRH